MAVDEKALKNHPGKNPEYDAGMKARRDAQAYNAKALAAGLPTIKVPRAPNKYIPHAGAKQQARGK